MKKIIIAANVPAGQENGNISQNVTNVLIKELKFTDVFTTVVDEAGPEAASSVPAPIPPRPGETGTETPTSDSTGATDTDATPTAVGS